MIGTVYKIWNIKTPKIYVGSTFLSIQKRFTNHKSNFKKGIRSLLYDEMRNVGIENVKICQLEQILCNDKKELRRAEGKHILAVDKSLSLNKNIAGRTMNEYMKEYLRNIPNLEQHAKYMKANYQKHKLSRKNYHIKYYAKCRKKILSNQRKAYRDAKLASQKII